MLTNLEFLSTWLKARFNTDDRGAALVEYALLIALIAVVCIAAINIIGGEAEKAFSSVGDELKDVNSAAG
jgi:pilus assembly protein Flp/PilA